MDILNEPSLTSIIFNTCSMSISMCTGGGAGHEPAHAGYVGSGMLSAAVCGEIFASPPAAAVLAAIRQVPMHTMQTSFNPDCHTIKQHAECESAVISSLISYMMELQEINLGHGIARTAFDMLTCIGDRACRLSAGGEELHRRPASLRYCCRAS